MCLFQYHGTREQSDLADLSVDTEPPSAPDSQESLETPLYIDLFSHVGRQRKGSAALKMGLLLASCALA